MRVLLLGPCGHQQMAAIMEESSEQRHEDSVKEFWAATEANWKAVIDPEFLERIKRVLADLPRELRRVNPEIAGTLLALRRKLEETREICIKYNICCQNLIDYFTNERLRRVVNECIEKGEKKYVLSFFQELRRRQGEIIDVFVRFEELVDKDKSWGENTAFYVQTEQNRYIEARRQKDEDISKYSKNYTTAVVGVAFTVLPSIAIVGLPLLCIFSYIAYSYYQKKKQTESDLESLRALEEAYLIVNSQFSEIHHRFDEIHSNLQACHRCMDDAEKIIMRIIDNRANALENNPVEQFNTERDIQELEQTFDKLSLHAQTATLKQENLEMDPTFDLMNVLAEN